MTAKLLLLWMTTFVGSVLAQYPPCGCARPVSHPGHYALPSYPTQCLPPPRVSAVPYNYYPPPFIHQNILPPPCPVYQPPPIIVPIPTPPKECPVGKQPGHQHGYLPDPPRYHPEPPQAHPSHPSIPGLSDAESKQLPIPSPERGSMVVQSVFVGKKEKEKVEEKAEKDSGKGECKKKEPKKKCSAEVEDDDDDHEQCTRRKRRRRTRKHRRRYYPDIYEPVDPFDPFDFDPCAHCKTAPQITYRI